jgi:hypothetical protein
LKKPYIPEVAGKMTKNIKSQVDVEKLNALAATILAELGEIGIFHFNKLIYLFEWLYIKNFGERYTGEYFIKLPHGPVISNYKKTVMNLCSDGIAETDITALNKHKRLDDDLHLKIPIKCTERTKKMVITNKIIYQFLKQILYRYANLSCADIEKEVYKTAPVKHYLSLVESGERKATGGYLLKSPGIREYSRISKTIARKHLLEIEKKYPVPNADEMNNQYIEWKFLEQLRPQIDASGSAQKA